MLPIMGESSGRVLRTDGTAVNVADILAAVYDAVNGVIKTTGGMSTTVTNQRFPAISITGQAIIDLSARRALSVQNVGTVPLLLWYNTTGLGDPVLILAAGTASDDGNGAVWIDESWGGAVYAKAGTGTGAALVMTY